MREIIKFTGTFLFVIGFIAIVAIASSITTFTLIEQYNHNYKNLKSDYYRVKVTINGSSSDYYIKELYEDSKTYKIIDDNDIYHIVYKEDCEFYGRE